MSSQANFDSDSAVAIIGMSGRFPKAKNLAKFWSNLRDSVDCISSFTDDELLNVGILPEVVQKDTYVKLGGILDDVELFDAEFFGFSPREAERTDPQHRLFLEVSWEALEDAGYDPQQYDGQIGVYASAGLMTPYFLYNLSSSISFSAPTDDILQLFIANDKDYLATRVSYKLDLHGPSMSIQTACSSSLVSVLMACQGLQAHQCDMALAGGVWIRQPQRQGYHYQEGGIFSPDGRCRSLDGNARGTVPGSGVGVVALKRFSDAQADRDTIYAIIRGGAINNDGALKVGYTAPSLEAQSAVIAEALGISGVSPEQMTYVEAHGSATSLGDAIELEALTRVFRAKTSKKCFCAIGSVKSNIGHLDAAAGIMGLIKATLALKYKLLPASLHYESPNPQVNLNESPFFVVSKPTPWKTDGQPRIAGVSSFGLGGTNAHLVLQEASTVGSSSAGRPWHLLVLSARTQAALETATNNLYEYLKSSRDEDFADIAYTFQVGRRKFDYRRVVVCRNRDDALQALERRPSDRVLTFHCEPKHRPLVFLFPGETADRFDAVANLYRQERTFAEALDFGFDMLRHEWNLDLRRVLLTHDAEVSGASCPLENPRVAQPSVFLVEYALARLMMEWGVVPEMMIGYGVGEYVAACLAEVFSLRDALSLVMARARIVQQFSAPTLTVPLSEEQVKEQLPHGLSLIAVNAPQQCVVAGREDLVAAFHQQLSEQQITAWRLPGAHAFGSAGAEILAREFGEYFRKREPGPPRIPWMSGVTAGPVTPDQVVDPQYWAKSLRSTGRFGAAVKQVLNEPNSLFLELGHGGSLTSLVEMQLSTSSSHQCIPLSDAAENRQSDLESLYRGIGRLWLAGINIDWGAHHAPYLRRRVPAPTYPFERQTCWVKPRMSTGLLARQSKLQKKPAIKDWFYVPSWKRSTLLPRSVSEDASRCCLVFLDECGVGFATAKKLTELGWKTTLVKAGTTFGKLADGTYTINAEQQADYKTLIDVLRGEGHVLDTVIHMWAITSTDQDPLSDDFLQQCEVHCYSSLNFLASAIWRAEPSRKVQMIVAATNSQAVTGTDLLYPTKALALGPSKVIPLEYTNIACRFVDLFLPEGHAGPHNEHLSVQLAQEVSSHTSDSVVAYRGGYRWTQTYEPVQLDSPVEGQSPLRAGGVYLITGGLGGIGLLIAEYLAKRVKAKLILVGRSDFPPRSQWKERQSPTGELDDEVGRKIRQLLAIEAHGGHVQIWKADVANQEQMQAVVNQARQEFGEINGVFHAAGALNARLIETGPSEEGRAVLSSKVRGTVVLHRVLQDKPLDFVVLFSSTVAVTGALGLAAYCGANAVLEAFAQDGHVDLARRMFAIGWDLWPQTGMGTRLQLPSWFEQLEQDMVSKGILPEEGIAALDTILSYTLPHVIVSTQDLPARIDTFRHAGLTAYAEAFRSSVRSEGTHPRPQLPTEYVAPRNDLEKTLAEHWQEVLGLETVGIYDDFFVLGGHSLMGLQMISRLRDSYNVELPIGAIFNSPTIAEVARLIEENLTNEVESMSDEEAQSLMDAMSNSTTSTEDKCGGQPHNV